MAQAWPFGKRLEDIALYFCMVTDSVTGVQFSPMDESTCVKLRFSPDCCDTLGFANSMVDLLRYLDRENRRLEKLCLEQQNESDKERPDGSARKQRLYAGLLHPVVPGTGVCSLWRRKRKMG